MTSNNSPAKKPADETQGGGSNGRKTASSSKAAPPDQQAPKCPRCDSPNTKFCYYNNYSLTQPRHFCKTCRRYWTKGGALRNVPIGGGCRKNKRVMSSSSSRLSCSFDSKDSNDESDHMAGLKFFHHGIHGISPAMDFNLGGLSLLPRLNHHPSSSSTAVTALYNNNSSQFSPYGDVSVTSGLSLDPAAGKNSNNSFMGFNHPLTLASGSGGGGVGFHQSNINTAAMGVHTNLASSIESLSSINQDLHWKLQQQRLSMSFGTSIAGGDGSQTTQPMAQKDLTMSDHEKTPFVFHQGVSKPKEAAEDTNATEWFFGNSYAPPPPVTPTPTNSGGNGGGGGNENNNVGNWNNGNGHGVVQAWGDLAQQYNALP